MIDELWAQLNSLLQPDYWFNVKLTDKTYRLKIWRSRNNHQEVIKRFYSDKLESLLTKAIDWVGDKDEPTDSIN